MMFAQPITTTQMEVTSLHVLIAALELQRDGFTAHIYAETVLFLW